MNSYQKIIYIFRVIIILSSIIVLVFASSDYGLEMGAIHNDPLIYKFRDILYHILYKIKLQLYMMYIDDYLTFYLQKSKLARLEEETIRENIKNLLDIEEIKKLDYSSMKEHARRSVKKAIKQAMYPYSVFTFYLIAYCVLYISWYLL